MRSGTRSALRRIQIASLVCALSAVVGRAASARGGVAALGDSLGDEYRFPINFPLGGDRRGGGAMNYVEVLATLRPASFDFGPYSTASRDTPRNQGYEFNWARDGSTSSDLIAEGQHIGAAQQIAQGRVNLALVEIGGNDFRGVFLPGADPAKIAADTLTNTVTAVGTLLAAPGNARVAVANVPDITLLPEARFAALQDPTLIPLLAQVRGLINQYNAALATQLDALPGSDRIALVDINGILDGFLANPNLMLDGHPVETLIPGNGPDHLFVDVVHPGTVGSAYLANGFIAALNTRFASAIAPLGEHEIYQSALTVPEPGALALAIAPALLLVRRRRAA